METIIDHPALLQYLFYPRKARYGESHPHIRTVYIKVDEGITLGGRLHVAGCDCPTILFWHGNGEIASDYDDFQVYVRMGINFLAIDFRGYGESDGVPTGSNMLADALSVCEPVGDLLKRHHIRSKMLFILGRSLGCTAAVATAHTFQDTFAGLILESGRAFTVPLLQRIGLFHPRQMHEALGFRNHEKITEITIPTLIIHGEEDSIIPVSDAEAMYERSVGHPKKLLKIANAGHNDVMITGHDAYYAAIKAFVG